MVYRLNLRTDPRSGSSTFDNSRGSRRGRRLQAGGPGPTRTTKGAACRTRNALDTTYFDPFAENRIDGMAALTGSEGAVRWNCTEVVTVVYIRNFNSSLLNISGT
jgi:hypothetical protein